MSLPKIFGVAAGLFAVLAFCLVLQRPGLEHDEALLVAGGVHLLNSSGPLTLPHDPNTWVCAGRRCLPLMTVRYVGATKEYLSLPVLSIFGVRTSGLRLFSGLLALAGMLLLALSAHKAFGGIAGPAAAFILAINPAYLTMTLFDNGAIAVWMLVCGILYYAATAHLNRPSVTSAFALGLAAGIGVWARANFAWLLMAFLAGVLIVFRRKIFGPFRYWAALAGGAMSGSAPLLVYQLVSGGGTFEALGMFSSSSPLASRIAARTVMLAETLLYDREHRAMWSGPALPLWQILFFPAVVLLSCAVCWAAYRQNEHSRRAARVAATTLLLFIAVMFVSRMEVAEHHLAAVLPMAAFCAAAAAGPIVSYSKAARYAVLLTALTYGAAALSWDVATIRGLRRTGGRGQWSDAIFKIAGTLEQRFPGKTVKILDWGFQNNLYVLSGGRIVSRELFTEPAGAGPAPARFWSDQVRDGGLVLINSEASRYFPRATESFLGALRAADVIKSRITFYGRDGSEHASLLQVYPSRCDGPPGGAAPLGECSGQYAGLYPAESSGWRWTQQAFSIALAAPPAGKSDLDLELSLYIPDALISQAGPVTLSAFTGDLMLGSETYRTAGPAVFARKIDAGLLSGGLLHLDFALDKALSGSSKDARQLGVIVSGVVLR
jgi:hypothetical protein